MKILVADDHELFRNGISMSLSALDNDIEIITACDYEELIAVIEKTPDIDLILTDLAMPEMPWVDALRIIRGKLPDVPVVILSAVHDKQIVQKAVKMGVSGFIPKTSTGKVIISALHLILAGGIYLPPEILAFSEEEDILSTQDISSILTPRQREVLALIGEGKSNKIIAWELNLSEGTVKLHVTAILKALGVTNRTGAVVAASKLTKN